MRGIKQYRESSNGRSSCAAVSSKWRHWAELKRRRSGKCVISSPSVFRYRCEWSFAITWHHTLFSVLHENGHIVAGSFYMTLPLKDAVTVTIGGFPSLPRWTHGLPALLSRYGWEKITRGQCRDNYGFRNAASVVFWPGMFQIHNMGGGSDLKPW